MPPNRRATKKPASRKSARREKPKSHKGNDRRQAAGGSSPSRDAVPDLIESPRGTPILKLRLRLDLNRETFARLLPVSTRSLASIEKGRPVSDAVGRRLIELRRIVDALIDVVSEDVIGSWICTPNDAFGGLKPLEVVETR